MQLAIPLGKSRSFSRFAGLFLPVAPPEASKLPKHTLLMKPESLSRDEARHIIAEVEKHYLSAEDHVLVLPILALIEISPTALLFFIGKWRPYKTDSIVFRLNSSGLEMVEHVLFRLIWGAINDLAVFRGVPERCDVTMAFVNRENPVPNSAKPLLSLYWKYKAVIEYDAGFDTLHEYYGGEDNDAVEIERNPENAWVTVKWIDEPVKERSNNLEVHGKN